MNENRIYGQKVRRMTETAEKLAQETHAHVAMVVFPPNGHEAVAYASPSPAVLLEEVAAFDLQEFELGDEQLIYLKSMLNTILGEVRTERNNRLL